LYSHSLLSLPRYGDHRDLHSFPTRRSSDLQRSRRGDDHAGQYVCQVPDQREGGRTQEGVEGELAPDPVAQLGPELHDHSGRGCPVGWKVRDNMKLNDLLPAGARKVIYVTYALLTGLVAAAGQVLTSAAEVGFDTGDLPKYVTIVSTGLL